MQPQERLCALGQSMPCCALCSGCGLCSPLLCNTAVLVLGCTIPPAYGRAWQRTGALRWPALLSGQWSDV